ncbi:MFS transporter [Parenemella sanctibonifatiensis]|uniref:MFS transporter n=1 Tax=Parenemella sanctibonifatiensis TaxID=2016505 RepID=A0A255E7Y2_9ACTN|nr:MFS transporter [Parenemella sanctibonifatiensis]OYN87669.1 MFS transporter [Parenemella sanctibonifatiensis]
MSTPQGPLTRNQRLDRLKFNKEHGKLLTGSGIGWALDAMDVALISFILAALATDPDWMISKQTGSWIASIGFVGMAVGASLGGLLADRIGRRQVFALTLLIYGLATGASALAGGVAMLMVLRFLVGLGLGAELPIASTLVSEFAPRRIRGRIVVLLEAFWAVGWIAAAVIARFVIPMENGWRWALVIGMVPAAYALFVRFKLPESVRFLQSKGRTEEAEAAVRRFEEAGNVAPPEHGEVVEEPIPAGHQSIWSRGLRRRTAALWTLWFCINLSYYGAFLWIPTLLVDRGLGMVQAFETTLIMTLAQLPGYAAAAFLIEKWGRRPTLAVFLIGSAAAAFWFGSADTETMVLAAGCTLSFFNLGAWGALYAIGPELYPTTVRGTGTGAAAAFGRIASIIAPMLVPALIGIGGLPLAFGVLAGAFVVAAVAAFALPEMMNTPLTDATTPEPERELEAQK